MPVKKRFGFTVVELLVIISIIVIIAALLYPAIVRVREVNHASKVAMDSVESIAVPNNFSCIYVKEFDHKGKTYLVFFNTETVYALPIEKVLE